MVDKLKFGHKHTVVRVNKFQNEHKGSLCDWFVLRKFNTDKKLYLFYLSQYIHLAYLRPPYKI